MTDAKVEQEMDRRAAAIAELEWAQATLAARRAAYFAACNEAGNAQTALHDAQAVVDALQPVLDQTRTAYNEARVWDEAAQNALHDIYNGGGEKS